MELHRERIRETVTDPAKVDAAHAVLPVQLPAAALPRRVPAVAEPADNVTIVDCPAGIDRVTEHGVVVDGHEYELDCIVYATGFEPEVTPLPRRLGHEIIGRGGRTIAEKWADGEATLFGLMTVRVPEPVPHAVPRPSGRRHRELHAPHRGRRRARRRDRRRARGPRRRRLRRHRGSRGRLGATDPHRQPHGRGRRASGWRAVHARVTDALRRRRQHGASSSPTPAATAAASATTSASAICSRSGGRTATSPGWSSSTCPPRPNRGTRVRWWCEESRSGRPRAHGCGSLRTYDSALVAFQGRVGTTTLATHRSRTRRTRGRRPARVAHLGRARRADHRVRARAREPWSRTG